MLLAIAVLTLGLAEPALRVAGPASQRIVVLAVDVSPSMMATDVAPSRFEAQHAAVREFVAQGPDEVLLGLVSFAGTARVEVAPTTERDEVLGTLGDLEYRSNTSLAQAILTALNAIESAEAATGQLPASIVLLSDGNSNVAPQVDAGVAAASERAIPVSTIAFGTPNGQITLAGSTQPVPLETAELSRIAEETGGNSFDAATETELRAIYDTIGGTLAGPGQPQSIATWFFVLSLLLLIGAGTTSLVWFSGLP